MKRDVLAAARRRRAAAPLNTTDWPSGTLYLEPEGGDPSSGVKFGLERGFHLRGTNLLDKLISHARSSLSPKCTPRMSGFLESQRLPMSSSWITGGEAGTPSPAEIFVYPIFIRALARSPQLSHREELRRLLMHALLLPPWLPGDMSKARLCIPLAGESWLALWNALSCVSHETSPV